MPIIVMHLRWNHLTPIQADVAATHLEGLPSAAGCCSARVRRLGDALLLTCVWASEHDAEAFSLGRLADVCTAAHLAEPQRAVFAVPEVFGAAYVTARPVVPGPRAPQEQPAAASA